VTRILLRSPQSPFTVLDPLESTRKIGGNLGNLLYINAVHRALSTSGVTIKTGGYRAHLLDDPAEWAAGINGKYDRFVIPMSNMFRIGFTSGLEAMARIVEQLDMPVTVVGVGAQAPIDAVDPETGYVRSAKTGGGAGAGKAATARHDEVVHRFATAVLERSESIGVRGAITKGYLTSLGIADDRVDVIGCPSMYTWGPDLKISKRPWPITRRSELGMSVDHRVPGIGAVVNANVAAYPKLTCVVQDSEAARTIVTGVDQRDMSNPRFDLDTPIHTGHPLYQAGRMLWFPSPWAWIESFKSKRFAFGSRLHGNIAALLAGTPVHLLAHDTRTLELAEYHGIPYSMIGSYDEPPLAADLYKASDFSEFNALHPQRFATYLAFLKRNGFETVFDPGQDAKKFDAKIVGPRNSGAVASKPS
jgi:hypothetical protein